MWIRNTSKYPTPIVRDLVHFSAEHATDVRAIQINIKNSLHAFRGRAYSGIPSIARAHRHARYLITIGIGSPEKFPTDNLFSRGYWRPLKPGETPPDRPADQFCMRNGTLHVWTIRTTPYGGKHAPFITYADWREGLIGVAAHEFTHINQFRYQKPHTEHECEFGSQRALKAWRSAMMRTPAEETGDLSQRRPSGSGRLNRCRRTGQPCSEDAISRTTSSCCVSAGIYATV
jgi:hypothetical protein